MGHICNALTTTGEIIVKTRFIWTSYVLKKWKYSWKTTEITFYHSFCCSRSYLQCTYYYRWGFFQETTSIMVSGHIYSQASKQHMSHHHSSFSAGILSGVNPRQGAWNHLWHLSHSICNNGQYIIRDTPLVLKLKSIISSHIYDTYPSNFWGFFCSDRGTFRPQWEQKSSFDSEMNNKRNLPTVLCRQMKFEHPSIHPSIHHLPLVRGSGRGGSSFNRETQASLSPATSSSSSGGTPRHSQASRETYSLQHVLGLPRDLLPVGHARNTSSGRHPGGILIRCPSLLIWLLSMWRSSGSTPSPSRMTELLTLSLRESPDILRRKPISAACIRDLVLSVTTHNSWP